MIAEGEGTSDDMRARGSFELDRQRIAGRQIKTVASRAFGVVAIDRTTKKNTSFTLCTVNDHCPRRRPASSARSTTAGACPPHRCGAGRQCRIG